MRKVNQNQSGSALLLMLIITAVIGILSHIYLQRMDSLNFAARMVKNRTSLMAVSNHILTTISCAKTLASCTPGNPADLINFADGLIITEKTAEGDLISGPWLIHVSCDDGELEISRANSGLPKVNNGDSINQSDLNWAPVFPDGTICNDCTAAGLSAPFPYGMCRES